MEVTKELQDKILEYLKDCYLQPLPKTFEEDMTALAGSMDSALEVLSFLIQEGLVSGKVTRHGYSKISITSAGLKAISDEEIGAETVITAKLHQESLDFLAALVEASREVSPDQKSVLLSAVRSMPAAVVAEIAKHIVGQGIEYLQAALK